jgi:hypothetical protein
MCPLEMRLDRYVVGVILVISCLYVLLEQQGKLKTGY